MKPKRLRIPGPNRPKPDKKLKAHARLALTGTPVENRLGDLWSIFDFVNPGLLGTSKQFTAFAKRWASATTARMDLCASWCARIFCGG